jgi:riboflavin kinase / FMN adenylyltransferase
MDTHKWYSAKVINGSQKGRTIGFPTMNLDNPALLAGEWEGVYAALIKIEGKIYQGALFFGPRKIMKDIKPVLEIHVFDFDKEIYGQEITFSLQKYVRETINFSNFSLLRYQLDIDKRNIQTFFRNASQ